VAVEAPFNSFDNSALIEETLALVYYA